MSQESRPNYFSRRSALQTGATAVGTTLAGAASAQAAGTAQTARPRSVIFIFLTGGLSHIDTFDMKPAAPDNIRGEFKPVATKTAGTQVCEHLPRLGQLSETWTIVRSMATASNGHEPACHMMLTGRMDLPVGFNVNDTPSPNEWPTIPAVITYAKRKEPGRLPFAAVLPEPSVNEAGRFRPGQYAGRLGTGWEPWHIDIAAKCTLGNGACPDCFRFEGTPFEHGSKTVFDVPTLALPRGGQGRFNSRIHLLDLMQSTRGKLRGKMAISQFDRHRQQAASVLVDPKTSSAFAVEKAPEKQRERYGHNKFGLSLLMARRLVEAGVRFVQVNLGKNSSWDTHRRNFVNLKENLLPPMDLGVSALLTDLKESGMLDDTLVIMSGEFGRTPKINKDAGRDHWGPLNTMLFAGGGVQGGRIIGSSDRNGTEPIEGKQTPENLSATMYKALGIPRDAVWHDVDGRPHAVYRGQPIHGLI